jgi:cytochrome c peroxidase
VGTDDLVRLAIVVALVACGGGSKTPPKEDGKQAPPEDAAGVVLPPAPPLPKPPDSLAKPNLPDSVTPEAVALGELLFWDTRLSIDNRVSCATCHVPAEGYAGAKRQNTATNKPNLRRAPTLLGMAWQKELGWDGRYGSLAEHLPAHLLGQMGGDLTAVVTRINAVPGYRAHFQRLGDATAEVALQALGAYVLTRYPADAPWDRVERAPDAPKDLVAGYQLFQTKAQCSVCHTPPLYTDLKYHRLGLIASSDEGRGRVEETLKGAFKTPTLRGAADRRGFFHDASAATLDAAIDWHLAGATGQGADPKIIDPALRKVTLTPGERKQLGDFVRALTDARNLPAPKPPALP